jgi:hypothetical protein
VFGGLPEGRWILKAVGVIGDDEVAAEVEADAGATLDVTLQPR